MGYGQTVDTTSFNSLKSYGKRVLILWNAVYNAEE